MKIRLVISLVVSTIFAWSCTDSTLTDLGSSIQPAGDLISVSSDTFHLSSENYFMKSIIVKPDTFMLGSFYDTKYGSTFADILAQVDYPQNHVFHEGSVADSIVIVMFFNNWFGDSYSPMELSVYEMTDSIFDFNGIYPSNLNVSDYCDKSLLIGKKTITASDYTNSRIDTSQVVIKLSDDFLKRFSNFSASTLTNDEDFLKHFKGFYITPSQGSAVMLYVNEIFIEYYYHYTYTTKDISGNDSVTIVKNAIPFSANHFFRQVNRIVHPDTAMIKTQLSSGSNIYRNFLSSPANIGTRINLPLQRMADSIHTNGKKLNINGGILKVYIDSLDNRDIPQPLPSNLLLIRESSADRFFSKEELPSDTVAILSARGSEYNDNTGEYDYYYYFDISKILSNQIKPSAFDNMLFQAEKPEESFLLVPVSLVYDSNSTMTAVKHLTSMSAISLCGANHPVLPMRVNFIYSGF